MATVPFHYLRCRAFCYATEDERRVRSALSLLLPPDVELERRLTEGHHGDPIVVLTGTLETSNEMRQLLERLPGLPGFDRILTDLDDRIDEDCAFYLRLDKQRAYQGDLSLGAGIQLRGKVEAYPAKRESALQHLRSAFQTLAEEYHVDPTGSR